MSVMSVRLPDEVEQQLGQLAQSTGRTKGDDGEVQSVGYQCRLNGCVRLH